MSNNTKTVTTETVEHSKNFEKYKRYYDSGFWNDVMLRNVVAKGKITPEEYKEITGEDYE